MEPDDDLKRAFLNLCAPNMVLVVLVCRKVAFQSLELQSQQLEDMRDR